MKYALLIYTNSDNNWDALSEDEQKGIYGEYYAISEAPGVSGGEQLGPADTATTVRVQNGSTLTTDGPFAETKEVLGGFYLFEADDPMVVSTMKAIEEKLWVKTRVGGVARYDATLVDLCAAGLVARRAGLEPALFAGDGFHPSTAGHRALAGAFIDALRT